MRRKIIFTFLFVNFCYCIAISFLIKQNNLHKNSVQDLVDQMSEGYFMFDSLEANVNIEREAFVEFADLVLDYFPTKKSFKQFPRRKLRVDLSGLNDVDKAVKLGISSIAYIESRYGDLIDLFSAKRQVDPLEVKAHMAIESHGDRKAVSDSGAIGLMQIMPATALYMGYRARDLVKPHISIEIGCKYIAESQKRFNGNEAEMIVAYNAGNQSYYGINREVKKYGSIEKVPYFQKVNGVLQYLRARDKAMTLADGELPIDVIDVNRD